MSALRVRWVQPLWCVGIGIVFLCSAPILGHAGSVLDEVERQHIGLASRVAPAVVAILGEHPGSGVLISPQGHILTCLDALPKSGREMKVRLFGGRQVSAKVLKRYPGKNVAVLQIPGDTSSCLAMFGNNPEVGTLVFAVGNTVGVYNTTDQPAFHAGVVSGLFTPEEEVGAGAVGSLIETDAGVNPGIFGGALVDVDGKLRGLLSSYYSERRWWGTAIPLSAITQELRQDFGWAADGEKVSGQSREIQTGEISLLKEMQSAFREAAVKVARCVVTVKADRPVNKVQMPPRTQVEKRYRMMPQDGMASGVIVDADGYILTASFNVDKADSLSVVLPDGRSLGASLVAADEERDLALLKVDAKGLPEPEWAPRESLRVGHWTVVVGRDRPNEPFTISTGIVSALSRVRGNAFETDAQVNYGNAGGAVVDVEGRLLGVATRVDLAASHGINSGVSFAAPGDLVRDSLPQLRGGKSILAKTSPFLGIAFKGDEEDIDGVHVESIVPNSGAAQSGLKPGDVVVGLNEKDVYTRPDLLEQVRKCKPGEVIQMRVRRGEEILTLSVKVGKRAL